MVSNIVSFRYMDHQAPPGPMVNNFFCNLQPLNCIFIWFLVHYLHKITLKRNITYKQKIDQQRQSKGKYAVNKK